MTKIEKVEKVWQQSRANSEWEPPTLSDPIEPNSEWGPPTLSGPIEPTSAWREPILSLAVRRPPSDGRIKYLIHDKDYAKLYFKYKQKYKKLKNNLAK